MNQVAAPSFDSSVRQAGTAHGVVLLAAAVMPIMAITGLIPVLPALMREFADVPGSTALVPIALTVPALCVALFSPLAGWLSDRMGRKNLLVGALVAYGIVGFLPWFLVDLMAIIAARVLLGITEAVIMTLSTALIGDYFEGANRQRWISIQIAVGSLSATVLLAAGGMLGDALGTRGPFLLYLSAFGVAIAAAWVLHEPAATQRLRGQIAGAGRALAAIVPLSLVTLGVGIAFYTVLVQIGPILELTGSVSPGTIGLVGALANLGVVGGSLVYRLLNRHTGPVLLALGLVLTAAGYAGVGLSEGIVSVSAFAVLACFGTGILLPNLLSWTMGKLPAPMRGRGMGLWTGAFFLGQFIAPLLTGALAGAMGGLDAVIRAMAVLIALFALGSALLARRGRAADMQP
jgi:MFS family permease